MDYPDNIASNNFGQIEILTKKFPLFKSRILTSEFYPSYTKRERKHTYCLFHIYLAARVLWAAAALLTTPHNFGFHAGDRTFPALRF